MKLDFSVVANAWQTLISGTLGTLYLAIFGMGIALVLGIFGVAVLRAQKRIPTFLVNSFIEIIRNA